MTEFKEKCRIVLAPMRNWALVLVKANPMVVLSLKPS